MHKAPTWHAMHKAPPTHPPTWRGMHSGASSGTYTTASVTSSVRLRLWKKATSLKRTYSPTPARAGGAQATRV